MVAEQDRPAQLRAGWYGNARQPPCTGGLGDRRVLSQDTVLETAAGAVVVRLYVRVRRDLVHPAAERSVGPTHPTYNLGQLGVAAGQQQASGVPVSIGRVVGGLIIRARRQDERDRRDDPIDLLHVNPL